MIHISQLQHQDTLFFLPANRGSTFLQQSVNFCQTSRHHGSEGAIIYNPCVFNTDNVDRCPLLTMLATHPHTRLPSARAHTHSEAIVYS